MDPRPSVQNLIALNTLGDRAMNYVDGFVLPVPEKNLDAYFEIARKAGEIWKEFGSLCATW